MPHRSKGRDFLDSVREGADSLRAALSRLSTRKKPAAPAAPPTPSKPVPDGPRWGNLVLLDKVGEGSFGEVYRAWDTTLEREVALKLMRAAADEHPALLQEARMLARVEHPNVVTVYGADRHDGRSGIWTQFIDGDTLAELLEERGSFGAYEALLVGIDVCRALGAVHLAGLLHRDVKAQNVMRERGGRVVLMDFGLGHDAAGGAVSDFGGTPLYMAPEVLRGESPSARSDLYSAGVLLFHMVTRAFPVEGKTVEALQAAHEAGDVALLRDHRTDLPRVFVRAVEKAIEAEPSRRYGTAGAMTAALEAALGGRRFAPVSRRAWLAAAPAAAIGAGGWWYWQHRESAAVATGASLLLAEVSNATADRQLDAVTEVLRNQLGQSTHFNLLDVDRVRETLRMMTRSETERPDTATAREIAARTQTPLVVYGTLSALGAGYGLAMAVERIEGNPRSPRATETKLFEAPSKNGLFDAARQAAIWIRQVAGEAQRSIAAADTQPEEATTSSWEALDYFAQGERLHREFRYEDAMAMYQRAVAIDPGFALAWASLAGDQSTTRRMGESYASYRQAVNALEKRRVTRREELRIRGIYAISTQDYASGEALMHSLTLEYPRDATGRHYRALALRYLGRLEEASSELKIAQELRPSQANLINQTAVALLLGRFGEAASRIQELGATGSLYEGQMKFLQRDFVGAETAFLAVARTGDARLRSLAVGSRACLLAELGRHRDAVAVLEEGIATETASGMPGGLARKQLALVCLRILTGQREQARVLALDTVRHESDTVLLARAGTLLARAGFLADARRVQARIDAPEQGGRFEAARSLLAGEIASAEGRKAEAVSSFEQADRLTAPIRPRDFLARGWDLLGRKEEALAVWRRMEAKPELIWSEAPDLFDPGLWSESLLRGGELALRLGFRDEGRAALEQFLKIREHADTGSPQSTLARKLLQ